MVCVERLIAWANSAVLMWSRPCATAARADGSAGDSGILLWAFLLSAAATSCIACIIFPFMDLMMQLSSFTLMAKTRRNYGDNMVVIWREIAKNAILMAELWRLV